MELCGWLCTGNNDCKGESEIGRAGTATTVPEGTSERKEAASSLVSVGLAAAHTLRNGAATAGVCRRWHEAQNYYSQAFKSNITCPARF